MMRRRSFLSITGLANLSGVWQRERQPQIGFLTADMAGAQGIDKITLDGKEVDRVFELDDVEGWVRFYTPEGRVSRRTGEVEVFWEDLDKIPIRKSAEVRRAEKRLADAANRFDLDEWEAEEQRREDKCRSRDVRRAARREANSGRLESASQDPVEKLEPPGREEPLSDPKP